MSAQSGIFYDKHTFFVKCETATPEQINQVFLSALKKYQDDNNVDLNCRVHVNLVENREGQSYGIAFVFVTNSEVYHMLLGKNPDGSDRVEYRDDPSWQPPKDGESVNESGWATISPPVYTKSMSWAEISEADDEYEHQLELQKKKLEQSKNKLICPKIPVPLDPLMVLPPYKLNSDQIKLKRDKIIADNQGKKDFDPSKIEIPEFAYLNIDRAIAVPLDPKFMPNILKCKNVPDWVTKEDIKMQLAPFASDSTTIQERFIKGRKIEETYPFVNINEDKVAFVIFDPSTHDGQFALHNMKKTIIRKRVNNEMKSVTLIFGHSFRTERDIMADISQKPRPVKPKSIPQNKPIQRPPITHKNTFDLLAKGDDN